MALSHDPSARREAVPSRAPLLLAQNLFLPGDLGGSRYPLEVVQRMARRGHPVTVVTARLHERLPSLPGVSYRVYPVARPHPLVTHATNVAGSALALASLRGAPFAAALSGSYDVALACALTPRSPRLPLVFLYHSQFYSEWVQSQGRRPRALARRTLLAYMAWVERRVFCHAAAIVAVSQFSARQVRQRAPWAGHKIQVIPTGVDTSFFVPPQHKGQVRQSLGFAVDGPLLLGVGRLVGVKQFDRLLRAFASAQRRGLGGQLVLAGDGPERPALERLAVALGVAERVHLAGYCDSQALRALMQAADLQVCSSAFENFSLAILEAFACGTPVLGTPGGGTPELVGALGAGFVLRDDSPEALAEGLIHLGCEPDRLRQAGAAARALVLERYDWERVVDQVETLCQAVSVPT